MGNYATENIWQGQKVMLVNQEQTSDPEENSRLGLVEKSELSHEWDEAGNPLGLVEGTEGSREPPPSGDPINYAPMKSGCKMYSPRHLWYNALHQLQLTIFLGWRLSLIQEFSFKKRAVAEAPELHKDLWLTCLSCGGLSAAEQCKNVNMAKVSTICWQFMRCGTDVMYLLDTRLSEPQRQKKDQGDTGASTSWHLH